MRCSRTAEFNCCQLLSSIVGSRGSSLRANSQVKSKGLCFARPLHSSIVATVVPTALASDPTFGEKSSSNSQYRAFTEVENRFLLSPIFATATVMIERQSKSTRMHSYQPVSSHYSQQSGYVRSSKGHKLHSPFLVI
ncbi:hypothetical protein EVAR_72313_1 [Eumeta japonica]|uniref:Uncharacterized protein n=1 Tax=Eumeta variegata TaxID=151549 RepID=A0A4C1TH63_EUMVA|nr:hypothetical protein EVAR_72313_1 [Eumeta japonica]